MTNILQKKLRKSLETVFPLNKTEFISRLWCRKFQILVVIEKVGAIIIQFYDSSEESQQEANLEEMEDKTTILTKIKNFPSSMACIHSISVGLGAESTTDPSQIQPQILPRSNHKNVKTGSTRTLTSDLT
jgi:hypothetical protein